MKSYDICLSLWLISLSIMPSRSIHVVANGKISLFFHYLWLSNNILLCVCVRVHMHACTASSSIDGYLVCFQILAMVSNAAVNRDAFIFELVFHFIWVSMQKWN